MQTITVDGRKAILDIPADQHTASTSQMLAEALAKMLVKSGMLADGAHLTGPHLLQFAEEFVEHSQPAGTIVGTLQYESSKCGLRFGKIYGEQPFEFEAHITIVADDQTADDDDLNEALEPFWGKRVVITLDPTADNGSGQTAKVSGIKIAE